MTPDGDFLAMEGRETKGWISGVGWEEWTATTKCIGSHTDIWLLVVDAHDWPGRGGRLVGNPRIATNG